MIKVKLLLFNSHSVTKLGYPIKIRVTETSSKTIKYLNLKHYSFLETWNNSISEPTTNHPEYNKLLSIILDFKFRIHLTQEKANENKLTVDQVIQILSGPTVNEYSFSEYAQATINELIKHDKKKTASKKQTALNSLEAFYGNNNILFEHITKEFLRNYVKWAKIAKGMSSNGIHTYLAALKSIYNAKMDSTLPFKGVMPKIEKTRNKTISVELMQEFYNYSKKNITNPVTTVTGMENCIDYFVLCFFLGGLDLIDIYNLKTNHIQNGRIVFQRHKGGTNEWINNLIVPFASKLIKKYNSTEGPFLFPTQKIVNYDTFYSRYRTKISLFTSRNKSAEYISSKSPRYSFINYAKNAGVPREVCSEIVGHAQNDVHSIYESGFSDEIKNKYHVIIVKIIKK
jgi:integrase